MRRLVFLFFLPLALLLLLPTPISAGSSTETRWVTVGETRLLSAPRAFATSLATLDAGDAVVVVGKKGGYLQVKVGGKSGWLPERSLATERPKIGASRSGRSDASSEEIAAATKGFSSEVESEYSGSHPNLDYKALDRLEERTAVADPLGSLEAFRREAKIGEFAEAKHE